MKESSAIYLLHSKILFLWKIFSHIIDISNVPYFQVRYDLLSNVDLNGKYCVNKLKNDSLHKHKMAETFS